MDVVACTISLMHDDDYQFSNIRIKKRTKNGHRIDLWIWYTNILRFWQFYGLKPATIFDSSITSGNEKMWKNKILQFSMVNQGIIYGSARWTYLVFFAFSCFLCTIALGLGHNSFWNLNAVFLAPKLRRTFGSSTSSQPCPLSELSNCLCRSIT